jgi:hypothetical protein
VARDNTSPLECSNTALEHAWAAAVAALAAAAAAVAAAAVAAAAVAAVAAAAAAAVLQAAPRRACVCPRVPACVYVLRFVGHVVVVVVVVAAVAALQLQHIKYHHYHHQHPTATTHHHHHQYHHINNTRPRSSWMDDDGGGAPTTSVKPGKRRRPSQYPATPVHCDAAGSGATGINAAMTALVRDREADVIMKQERADEVHERVLARRAHNSARNDQARNKNLRNRKQRGCNGTWLLPSSKRLSQAATAAMQPSRRSSCKRGGRSLRR